MFSECEWTFQQSVWIHLDSWHLCVIMWKALVSECMWAPPLRVRLSPECKHILSLHIRKEWQGDGETGTVALTPGRRCLFHLPLVFSNSVMAVTYCMDKNINVNLFFFISATIHMRAKMFFFFLIQLAFPSLYISARFKSTAEKIFYI